MINYNGTMSPNKHMHRTMAIIGVSAAVVGAGATIYSANKSSNTAKGLASDASTERAAQQAVLNKQKDEYKSMSFQNPFSNMENTYEDLTVNQQQAQFQSQQGNQQQANIMQNLKGAAGSSGIAGLAQSLANQGQLQTQRISTSIGQQESRNQMAAARGASAVQTAARQGDQWVQQANMDRQATLLGMQMGQATGANMAHQQAQANQMNAQVAQTQAWADGVSSVGTTAASGDWDGGGGTKQRTSFKRNEGRSDGVISGGF